MLAKKQIFLLAVSHGRRFFFISFFLSSFFSFYFPSHFILCFVARANYYITFPNSFTKTASLIETIERTDGLRETRETQKKIKYEWKERHVSLFLILLANSHRRPAHVLYCHSSKLRGLNSLRYLDQPWSRSSLIARSIDHPSISDNLTSRCLNTH